MTRSPFNWDDISRLDLERPDLYFRLQQVTVYVRDVNKSLKFYVDQLGFSIAYEARLGSGEYWAAVAPPDGPAIIALVNPKPDSEESRLIGRHSQVAFLTEDVNAKYLEWSNRGVHFYHPPEVPKWGGVFTTFDDLDGNSFGLVASTKRPEISRLSAARSLRNGIPNVAKSRSSRSPGRYRRDYFPKHSRHLELSTTRVGVFRPARSAVTTTIFFGWETTRLDL